MNTSFETKVGYLVFTTHDGDELDATFIPESEVALIEQFKSAKNQRDEEVLQGDFAACVDRLYTAKTLKDNFFSTHVTRSGRSTTTPS